MILSCFSFILTLTNSDATSFHTAGGYFASTHYQRNLEVPVSTNSVQSLRDRLRNLIQNNRRNQSIAQTKAKNSVSQTAVLPKKSMAISQVRPFPQTDASWEWSGHFSAENFRSKSDMQELINIKSSLASVFEALPPSHTRTLKDLEVRNKTHVSRGMANGKKLILNIGSVKTNEELMAVFIHEIGHVVDLGKFTGKFGEKTEFTDGRNDVLSDDKSVDFYRISWVSTKNRTRTTLRKDFVSGYAMNDPFEDFAESYLFYRVHGEKFRKIMQDSEALQKKYAFIKDNVFNGKEFQLNKTASDFVQGVIWDATLLGYGEGTL